MTGQASPAFCLGSAWLGGGLCDRNVPWSVTLDGTVWGSTDEPADLCAQHLDRFRLIGGVISVRPAGGS